ncbi:WD40 repeat-like protein [Trametes versicolor FP-101664 SS1]|uniref:WD40 repeat-like protein n=1 Tax=Trametes versicolor (strain FP-101664) TaxID=717944 RepID=UPI000462148F|nr:WD40 repeat-like protein [Trametes versicolor FP-101664 SS1]EIW59855.1 WD40 repeat-like protein [Trametes versicolor FP-101664 SS1]
MSARTSSTQGALPKPILKKARVGTELPNSTKKKLAVREKARPDSDTPKTAPSKGKGKQREAAAELKPKLKKKKATSAVTDPSSSTSPLPASFKIVCGSYEKLLYGLEGTVSCEESAYSFQIAPIFIFPAHVSCIKSVAASPQGGKWLATGSADEIIKVWDLRRRKEIGGLMHHEGSITHLEFPSRSHLLSASEDGTLSLFRARDWAVLRSLKGHKGRVNSVAVHQSCKVALSVGKDRTLRMWDLMRGKGSASTKLGKEAELVRWSTDGSLFAVQAQNTIDIYSTDMELLHTLTHPSRLHDIKFCKRVDGDGELLLAGGEDKKLSIYDVPKDHEKVPTIIADMVGHANRVKAVDIIRVALPEGASRSSTTVVCTISSDGKVRLFDLAALPVSSEERTQLEPVAEYDTKGTRLTCVALAEGDAAETSTPVAGKRKREDEEEAEQEPEWEPQHEEEGASQDEDGSDSDEE